MPSAPNHSVLRRAFIFCVLCLALFHLSDNTVDTDLWGHVLFGEKLLQTGHLPLTDPYSWTAPGHRWINHEILGEIALGAAHRVFGGPGLLLLKTSVGLLTFLLALAIGAGRREDYTKISWMAAWVLGALTVREISYGFAARPQIFTALALVLEFWLLRQIHSGRRRWAFALPPLFVVWINTHGGALAGAMVLVLAAIATTVQTAAARIVPRPLRARLVFEIAPGTLPCLWLSLAVSGLALFANPYGAELLRWLIGSVEWLRPEIGEWNPPRLSFEHAGFFLCVALAAIGYLCSRRPIALWEFVCTGTFAFMAFCSQRHIPLFCLAALTFIPPHLADTWSRLEIVFRPWTDFLRRPLAQKALAVFFLLAASSLIFATFTRHKDHPWTMEISRRRYAVAAVDFIKQHGLHGNLFVFFDWGEECLWELPDCKVSIDGRLDTCYPRSVITAQIQFYNAQPFNTTALDLNKADIALLPSDMATAILLGQQPGWQAVYVDDRALVLVRDARRFPGLQGLRLPVHGVGAATRGWAAFPDRPSLRLSAR